MKTQEFDAGDDISDFIDWSKAKRPNTKTKRVNVDFPEKRIGCTDRWKTRRHSHIQISAASLSLAGSRPLKGRKAHLEFDS